MPDQKLNVQMQKILHKVTGKVGIYAKHMESKKIFVHNQNLPFFMASTYKIPLAVKFLSLIEKGELKLEQLVYFNETDIRCGSGIIKKNQNYLNTGISLKELFHLMMVYSDNTATDLIFKIIKGPEEVNHYMQDIGVQDIKIHRTTLKILADFSGIDNLPIDEQITMTAFSHLEDAISEATKQKAAKNFFIDPKDTATPEAMGILLEKVISGSILNKECNQIVFDSMKACKTGNARIRALLPLNASVANKTGTLSGVVNDAGIIFLPNAEHIVLIIYVHDDTHSLKENEKIIAKIAQAIYYDFSRKSGLYTN